MLFGQYLDGDAEVYERPVDGEKNRVLVQWPELPALEGKVSISILHQHKGMEGIHVEGDFVLCLLVRHVGDPVNPPLIRTDPSVSASVSFAGENVLLRVLPAASQRATLGVSKKTTQSGSVTDTPTGGLARALFSSKLDISMG